MPKAMRTRPNNMLDDAKSHPGIDPKRAKSAQSVAHSRSIPSSVADAQRTAFAESASCVRSAARVKSHHIRM